MEKDNISQEFWLKNIDEKRNRAKLIDGYKVQKVCQTLNYIENFLILVPAITRCISISAFASLLGIPIGIRSSSIGL